MSVSEGSVWDEVLPKHKDNGIWHNPSSKRSSFPKDTLFASKKKDHLKFLYYLLQVFITQARLFPTRSLSILPSISSLSFFFFF